MSQIFFKNLIYSMGGQRFTQNSPIMPDVWMELAMQPDQRLSVLLTPNQGSTPGLLSRRLKDRLTAADRVTNTVNKARLAHNQTVVVGDLLFEELIAVAVPMSVWWKEHMTALAAQLPKNVNVSKNTGESELKRNWAIVKKKLVIALEKPNYIPLSSVDLPVDFVWLCRIAGTISLIKRYQDRIEVTDEGLRFRDGAAEGKGLWREDLTNKKRLGFRIVEELSRVLEQIEAVSRQEQILEKAKKKQDQAEHDLRQPCLWCINRNRTTAASLKDSAPAVKADAAQRVFEVSGRRVTWAVIDSGIDARHQSFRKRNAQDKLEEKAFLKQKDDIGRERWQNNTRVKWTFDLTRLRDLLTAEKMSDLPVDLLKQLKKRKAGSINQVARKMRTGCIIDWEILRPFIEIPHEGNSDSGVATDEKSVYQAPVHPHGTHVAGIIGGDWRPEDQSPDESQPGYVPPTHLTGVAPGVELIDVRVLSEDGTGDEFSMMAGLQFVRYLNSIHEQRQVHGVNLSFSLRHDFTAFACGQTPICQEAERLVSEGTIVVAAAGNEGTTEYRTVNAKTGQERDTTGYRSISITDPGNAENVITVGATHRRDPHTYGVSYFSSRGPTGDGRRKPDLVAPGEKIMSSVPNDQFCEMDGTSQAAPHVSGAVALLLERNPEMIGRPDRVKKIICETATDLGRDHYFQGAGMVDILRALQVI